MPLPPTSARSTSTSPPLSSAPAPRATAASATGRAARALVPSAVFRLADRLAPAALGFDGYRSTWVPTTAGRMHELEVEGQGEKAKVLIRFWDGQARKLLARALTEL